MNSLVRAAKAVVKSWELPGLVGCVNELRKELERRENSTPNRELFINDDGYVSMYDGKDEDGDAQTVWYLHHNGWVVYPKYGSDVIYQTFEVTYPTEKDFTIAAEHYMKWLNIDFKGEVNNE